RAGYSSSTTRQVCSTTIRRTCSWARSSAPPRWTSTRAGAGRARGAGGPAGTPAVVLGSQRVALPAFGGQVAADLAAYQGHEIIVGIRPEDLSLAESSSASAVSRLVADAQVVEMLGS